MNSFNSERKLLDCTLRDGGYVNDWEFGHNNLLRIFERLCDAKVDMIEVGFLDERRPFDINRSIFPNTKSIGRIWESCKKKPPMIAAMIDYGTCGLSQLDPAEDSFVDTIRVIFKEHLMREALEYCAEVKSMGYYVCAQLVSITTYSEDSLKQLIDLVNKVRPYAVSMVDTYGLLSPNQLLKIDRVIDDCLDEGISIGFHAHNNCQLAYANSMVFLNEKHQHDVFVDGTLYGMGKNAGNAPLELLALHLDKEYGKQYLIDPMLEAIEESIMDYYARNPWGYKLFYYLSSKNGCHPNYVGDLQKRDNLSMTGIDKVLSDIEPSVKLLYDKTESMRLYEKFIDSDLKEDMSDKALWEAMNQRNILIIGPGKNIILQHDMVEEYKNRYSPITISINYIPKDIHMDFVFVTNRYRYQQMTEDLHRKDSEHVVLIATSNVECVAEQKVIRVNRDPLLEKKEQIRDNSLLMLLQILNRIGIRKIALAGFDGYSAHEENYFNPNMEYSFVKDNAAHLNSHMREALCEKYKDMEITFVTYSHYQEEEDSHLAAF